MKVIDIQNREKFIYHPTNCISGVEYKENENILKDPDMKETEVNDYSIGYGEALYLYWKDKYKLIWQSEIDELLNDGKYEIPLYDTNPNVKNQ